MMILHAPHSILKTSNTLCPNVQNLISDLQSDTNKGKKARDMTRRHLSFFVCSWKQKYACIMSCEGGKKITK